jgi:2-oxoglutarate dehydrogenase E2 component (dihydrolipoamide succinyltransferase)
MLLRKSAALASSRARASAIRAPLLQARWNLRLASTVVKVPEMAESISEGTLKQFSKKVGDYVERDEEIATIETDKVSSNSSRLRFHVATI